jgi:magnesium chelatase accessory protein
VTPQQRLQHWRWPHREYSDFVQVGEQRWHVQRMGEGPALLLLHGTGAANHSWAELMPLLARDFQVVAPDLPGHGLSDALPGDGMSLPGMASAIAALLKQLDIVPALVAGHSAGAAILAGMCLDRHIAPRALISVNGAMLALPGMTGLFFSASARLMAAVPSVPAFVAGLGGRRSFTERMLESTGSSISGDIVERYRCLAGHPPHVAAALQMMARWDLVTLQRRLPSLDVPVALIACEADRTVPASQSDSLHRILGQSSLHRLPGLGHLGHEEDPARFHALFREVAEQRLIQVAADVIS